MAGAKVKNPRKKFLWQIVFVKHPIKRIPLSEGWYTRGKY